MKKVVGLVFLLASSTGISIPPRTLETTSGPPTALSNGILVGWKLKTGPKAIEENAHRMGLETSARFSPYRIFHFVSPTGHVPLAKVRKWCAFLKHSSSVESCGPNLLMQAMRNEFRSHSSPSEGNEKSNHPVTEKKRCDDILGEENAVESQTTPMHLTTFWAQYQIGADLAKMALADIKNVKPTPIGIFDSGFTTQNLVGNFSSELAERIRRSPSDFADPHPARNSQFVNSEDLNQSHGDQVANLVNASRSSLPYGVGHLSELVQLVPALYESDFAKFPLEGMKLANFSLGWMDQPARSDGEDTSTRSGQLALRVFDAMRRNGTILIKSAGNAYPNPVPEVSIRSRAILVGSSDPNGLPSEFSQEGAEVAVLAPSGNEIQSSGKDGKPHSFSGTSGAAPLVTGSLAAAVALLDGLTTEEAKSLLQHSATPNPSTPLGRNGKGILNQYRLVRAVLRLRNHWPANRNKISAPETYDFSTEARQKKNEAEQLLRMQDCAAQKKGFALLRESFLLDPGAETGEIIAGIYDRMNKSGNAEFYRNIGHDETTWTQVMQQRLKGPDEIRKKAMSAIARTMRQEQSNPLLREVASTDKGLRYSALVGLAQQGDLAGLRSYLDSTDSVAREDAVAALQHFKPLPPIEELTRAVQTGDRSLAITALVSSQPLGYRARPVFNALLEKLDTFSDDDKEKAFKNIVRGSWILSDLRNELLRDAAKKSPEMLVKYLTEIPQEQEWDMAGLLDTLVALPDEKRREGAIDQFEDFVRLRTPLSSENKVKLSVSIEKAWQHGRGSRNLYQIAASLGEAGIEQLQKFYDQGSPLDRQQILNAVYLSVKDANSDFWPLLRKMVKSDHTNVPNFHLAVETAAGIEPELVLRFMKHSSPQIRKALLDGVRHTKSSSVLAREDVKAFLLQSAFDPNDELAETAWHALGNSRDGALWDRAQGAFKGLKDEGRRRAFIYGSAKNPERWTQLFALNAKQTKDILMVSDAMIFHANRGTDEEQERNLKSLNALIRGEGQWANVRTQFFDAFFNSPKSQRNYQGQTTNIELVREWKARGYPPIDADLRYQWTHSYNEAITKLVEDADPGN